MPDLRKLLVQELTRIPGLTEKKWPARDDGFTSLQMHGKEFAHFHDDHEIDIRLTRKLITEFSLVHPADSRVHPNRSRNSLWIEMRFSNHAEVNAIVALVSRLFEK